MMCEERKKQYLFVYESNSLLTQAKQGRKGDLALFDLVLISVCSRKTVTLLTL